mgnify:CR=1 FL=1|tara:strand:- start:2499 stop:3572 length:1074 start_codon:yes stop_codon:yes gene_type:complete
MSQSNINRTPIHLVGSIPLRNAEEVFRTTSSILGDHLPRIPDGETGQRLQWIMFQYVLMAKMPEFEVAGGKISAEELINELLMQRQLQAKADINIEDIKFPSLGYADPAIKSYKEFKTLRENGYINENCRFQISLPTPLAPVQTFCLPKGYSDSVTLYNQYKKALLDELQIILEEIPSEDLALQWDVCIEIVMLENRQNDENLASWHAAIYEELCALADCVPEPVEVGYHFCYGDMDHKHFFEPVDTALMTELANKISQGVKRTIQWLHMPVPRSRDDTEYYQPLNALQLKKETQLFLGLVHHTDGLDGTQKRIDAALPFIPDFGIASECGLGRRDPATISALLEIHRKAADYINSV